MIKAYRRQRRVLLVLLLTLALAVLVWQLRMATDLLVFANNDFISYWAAGRLLLMGQNPYDPDALLAVQRSVQRMRETPMMLWNPPWVLPLIMPFSAINHSIARLLWWVLNFLIAVVCIDWLWRYYGGSIWRRWVASVTGFTFIPTIIALRWGQSSLLILAGVVLFLFWIQRRQWFLAGMSTLLIAVKPTLLYLFWIALLFWIIDDRRWRCFLGGITAGLVATGIALLFNPSLLVLYRFADQNPLDWAPHTTATLMRWFLTGDPWLQFVPSVVGVLWFLFYWRHHRKGWSWQQQMPLILLVSWVSTAFGWLFDQVVLLPAVLQGAVWLWQSQNRKLIVMFATAYLAINVLLLHLLTSPVPVFYTLFAPPALLILYLLVQRQQNQNLLSSATGSLQSSDPAQ